MSQPMSIMGFLPQFKIRRYVILSGETKAEAQARWKREAIIERERSRDPRREGTGRIAPVFYDD